MTRRPGRPRIYTPAEAAARDRQHKAASAKRRRPIFNENRRAKRWRDGAREQKLREGYAEVDTAHSTVSLLQLRRPDLKYIDAAGRVHLERWESAEQLIARLTRPNKKEDTKP